jgi:hypothetical protein
MPLRAPQIPAAMQATVSVSRPIVDREAGHRRPGASLRPDLPQAGCLGSVRPGHSYGNLMTIVK